MTRYTAHALLALASAIDADEADFEEAALMTTAIAYDDPDRTHIQAEIVLLAEAIRSLDD